MKFFFCQKVLIYLHIFIYYDFFISQILFNVPPNETYSTFLPIKLIEDHKIAYFGKVITQVGEALIGSTLKMI